MTALGSVPVKKTRGISPQSTLLRVVTNLAISNILPHVDAFSVEHELQHRVLGGSRGGQILDIVSCCQQALELGRDDRDRAAMGQMAIRTYHDASTADRYWRHSLAAAFRYHVAWQRYALSAARW